MKKCPYCAEEIQDNAIKCRFCNEFLIKKQEKLPFYFRTSFIIGSLLTVGPLALPCIIFHPRYKLVTKIIVSLFIIAFTVWISYYTMEVYQKIMSQLKDLNIIGPQ